MVLTLKDGEPQPAMDVRWHVAAATGHPRVGHVCKARYAREDAAGWRVSFSAIISLAAFRESFCGDDETDLGSWRVGVA